MLEEIKSVGQFKMEDSGQAQVASPTSETPRSPSFVGLRNALPSHIDIISPFVDQMVRFISRYRTGDGDLEIGLALREAVANAIVHGNQEDPHKRVYVNCRCTTDGEVSITIEDEGAGFDENAIPDPTSPENRLLTHGRGIFLMRTLMDDVHFEKGGSVVHMHKRAKAGSDTTRKPQ
jgi:serine/threonine-protein kinase RsbW